MNWYVMLDGQQTGPLTQEAIVQMIKNGQVGPDDWVWNESLPQWIRAGSVREFFADVENKPAAGSVKPADSRKKTRTILMVILAVLVVAMLITVGLLVRHLFFQPDDEPEQTTRPALSTNDATTTTEAETTADETTETTPAETTTAETTTEATTETEPEETDPEPVITPLTETEVLELISTAEQTALNLFIDAFEAEIADGVRPPFAEIKDDLLLYWSENLIEDLDYLYHEELDLWGYEMVELFPFHNFDYLVDNYLMIVERTDSSVIIMVGIQDHDMDESQNLYIIVAAERDRWVVDGYFLGLYEDD